MAITLKTQDIPAVPGWKLCSSCYKRVQVINQEVESNDQCYSQIESEQEQCAYLNESLESIGVSAIKFKSVQKFDQITEATTRKLKLMTLIL